MQEFSGPVIHVVKPDDIVTDDVFANAENRPDAAGFKRKVNGAWTPVTWREFAGQVRGLAAGQLTPTLKLRRYVIMQQYANQIAALDGDRAS